MRKALSLIALFFMSMTMMAETVKIDFTETPAVKSKDKIVWTVGNVTFTVTKGTSTYDIMDEAESDNYCLTMYKNQVMTISTTDGTTINKVEFQNAGCHPTFYIPSFSSLQNCTLEYVYRVATLTATDGNPTSFVGILEGGYLNPSEPIYNCCHVEAANVELGGSTSGDITEPTDSIGGGSGDIIIPGDSIPGGIDPDPDGWEATDSTGVVTPSEPGSVNSEAYRQLYLDYLNYYYDHVRNHHIATWLYNYVERECDRLDDKFESQEACDNLYAYLLEKFNIIREMVGDTPYNGTSYKPQNFNTEKLDALAIHAEAYYDKIHVSHTGPAYNLSDALRDALLATYEIKTQADIERIYDKLLEEYNDVRRRCGDGPYGEDDEEADSDNPDYANLNSAIRRSGWFIEDLQADSKYAGIMAELQNALDEAKKALDSKKQSVIDAAAQALEDALLKAQNDKKEMDKEPEVEGEEGTPMAPIAPDLAQYTHKMMVHGSPWGINGLNMIMMRDKQGRLVQTMTVQARNGGREEIITDSVRTFIYTDTKMIEKLSVPEYDSDDNLTLIPMSHKETTYYKMADGGHREVCIDMREDDGTLTPMRKEETIFDAQGRKVSYKHYTLWNGEQLEYYYDYTYDEDGGFYTKGKNDWGENVHTYTCYDQNGNQTYKTDYMGLYIYEWDKQNHAQGYTLYRNYNVEDNTCTAIDESHQYKITETYDDGRTKTMKTSTGNTKTYVYADNQETETVNEDGRTTTYVRTFDADGRLLKMEKNGTALISEFAWSNFDADKVLGGVNKVDENMNWQISKGTTYWTSDKSLLSARRSFIFEGFKEDQTTTYNIVPLSLLPAESSENGITIPVGADGDQVVMEADGEIYLMDKGGKKRYSCKVGGTTVSVEGGKIVITGWTPIGGGSSSVRHKAPSKLDLEDGEYSIYIPENVVKVNDEPMQEMFTAITMEQEDVADSMAGIKTSADAAVYNLQGMKVENPTQGQIMIIKGRKVLVK